MLELNKIYNCDCRDGLKQIQDNFIDLTVTSCPYDDLRTYHDDEFAWNFDIFKQVANELYRVTKPGGVVVWVVGDQVVNGGETGTSFRQALYFQEIGFKIHDTMIYEKNSSTFPARINSKRYSQIFEYMFVFVKGKIRDDIKLIADKRNKWAGWTNWGTKTQYDKEGNLVSNKKNIKPTPEFSLRTNIWKYNVSFNDKTGHPAVFPEKLAEDHILSWTNEGDVVLDPFMGSGTTAKMAKLNKRNYIGFEKNADYYEVSLNRVAKYDGKVNEWNEETNYTDSDGVTDSLRVVADDEKEIKEKTAIFESLVEQFNEYANDMSSSILKTLKLTFSSKANDRRVEEVLKERGISGYTKEEIVAEGCDKLESPVIEKPASPVIEELLNEKTQEESNDTLAEAFKHYYNDKDAFVRDCVKILPNKAELKDESKAPKAQVLEPVKLEVKESPTEAHFGFNMDEFMNNIREMVAKEVDGKLRYILESPETLSKISKYLKNEQKEKQYTPISTPVFDIVDYSTNDSSTGDKELSAQQQSEPVQPEKRKRGRPKGSKNKPKTILNNPINFNDSIE